MTWIQAAIMGLLQGVTELFPVSSLGHSVIFPQLFGWHLDQASPAFLTFLVGTHFATALVLFLFFFRDWMRIFAGLGRSIRDRRITPGDTYAKLGWLLVMGTIPAGIVGLVLEKPLRSLFSVPLVAAAFLVVNGVLLFTAERLRKRQPSLARATVASSGSASSISVSATGESSMSDESDATLAALRFPTALKIGAAQAAALIPGISRSGSSMAGGLLAGLDNESAARFSFLLATPIIGAAALLKLPGLLAADLAPDRGVFLLGAVCAAIGAWFSTKFLLRFFEKSTLRPFALYCVVGGVVYFGWLMIIR